MEEKFNLILEKVNKLKEGNNPLDLSSKEDLAIGIMNLISLEEHFFFTYNKTQNEKYLELLNEIRELRKNLLKEIIQDYEGEVWCISKHLLAASMRLMEVGTKKLSEGKKKEAEELFHKSYNLWNLFWGVNLKVINIKDFKDLEKEKEEELILEDKKGNSFKKVNIFSKLNILIKSILDCCRE